MSKIWSMIKTIFHSGSHNEDSKKTFPKQEKPLK